MKGNWRRGRDSNPRYLAVNMISSHARSATLSPLRRRKVRSPWCERGRRIHQAVSDCKQKKRQAVIGQPQGDSRGVRGRARGVRGGASTGLPDWQNWSDGVCTRSHEEIGISLRAFVCGVLLTRRPRMAWSMGCSRPVLSAACRTKRRLFAPAASDMSAARRRSISVLPIWSKAKGARLAQGLEGAAPTVPILRGNLAFQRECGILRAHPRGRRCRFPTTITTQSSWKSPTSTPARYSIRAAIPR